MVWMEDNICIYRYGEILHTSTELVGTIPVIQGIYINWRESAFSSVVCKQEVCLIGTLRVRPQCGQLKPRMLKIQQFWAYILDFLYKCLDISS